MPALISDTVYFYSYISAAICHATLQCGTHIYMVLGDVTHFLFNPLSVKERDLRQDPVSFLMWLRIFPVYHSLPFIWGYAKRFWFLWQRCHLNNTFKEYSNQFTMPCTLNSYRLL